jgi:hydroxymethylglutaryl-CoA reductase
LAAAALKILGNPDAATLMGIVAAAGLANNFSAVKALVTGGIQQGHMRLHLPNLLRQLQAAPEEALAATEYFRNKPVTYTAVGSFLTGLRNAKNNRP